MKKKEEPELIDFPPEHFDELTEVLEASNIPEKWIITIIKVFSAHIWLREQVLEGKMTMRRLMRLLKCASEKFANLFTGDKKGKDKRKGKAKKKRKGGKGKRSISSLNIDKIVHHFLEGMKSGDPCPACLSGRMYRFKPGAFLIMQGNAPFSMVKHVVEQLRCGSCGHIEKAILPKELNESIRGDASARAVASLMKFQGGMPYFRTSRFTKNFLKYLSPSEIWNFTQWQGKDCLPIYKALISRLAQQRLLFADDTTVKILSLMKENKEENPKRRGMFTTAIQGDSPDGTICLYFSGRNTAGENLDKLLSHRKEELKTAYLMADALNNNNPKEHEINRLKCLMHARRNFVDLTEVFPEESRHVLELMGKVYLNDRDTQKMSDDKRLQFHQKHTKPILDDIYKYCKEKIEHKEVEPSSRPGATEPLFLGKMKQLLRLKNNRIPV